MFAKIDFDTAEKVPSKVRTRKYNGLTGNTSWGITVLTHSSAMNIRVFRVETRLWAKSQS